jgi:predicted transcriptional regulator
MKFGEIVRIVEGTILTRCHAALLEIECVAGSDLMSDVLAYTRPDALLLTGLTNAQVVRTAEMVDISAIVFVRGKIPDVDAVALAEEMGIPLACSPFSMFELCGRLYRAGLISCDAQARD